MKRFMVFLSSLILLGFVLSACGQTGDTGQNTPGVFPTNTGRVESPIVEGTRTGTKPTVTEEGQLPETGSPVTVTPAARGTSSPVRGAQVVPESERVRVTQLSSLQDFQVVDMNGNRIGTVNDYMLNMCEAHIIYILVDGNGNAEMLGQTAMPGNVETQGSRFLIPYEVVTLDNGVIDVGQQAVVVNVDASRIAGAPVVEGDLDLQDPAWEADVRTFWSDFVTLSGLTTGCRVPAPEQPEAGGERVNVTRIALASQTLGARVVDGNGDPVGQVAEIILTPESGLLRFVAVRLDESIDAQGVALVPIGSLNVRHEEGNGATQPVLELLVERSVLRNSPVFSAVPAPQDTSWEDAINRYWSQYVPLTREQLRP
jgi:sporulation protein YlmC with PRC-barrel domain